MDVVPSFESVLRPGYKMSEGASAMKPAHRFLVSCESKDVLAGRQKNPV